ncbi:rhodanese [Aureimonas sp. Leaf454]|uniref:PQQ-dependent catabolism-associated CXXCW motif protein n=1 Tax=Aureimonas sp. Leaf454 TaxID=1736381 RepID=UPI00070165BF|nr:PQQ-dependent catabolism-associated CXXCW motif protein [Aureimonas sp. Leaf454]KQT47513.1 rhodanese [Aureimonas sp. Leaf454]
MRRGAAWLAIALLSASTMAATAADGIPEPAAYRLDDYRSPTPDTLAGASVVDTPSARRLFEEKAAIFVDTLPRAPKPQGLPEGTVWRPKPRSDIPGSIWLVDTGYGELAPVMKAYFRDGLVRATKGDKSRALVFYCLRDCWMSWNAAKRAIGEGYTAVHWYPDGTDGWAEAGLPLEPREPEPRPDE